MLKQPLIWSPSDLSDRLEPHDTIYSAVQTMRAADVALAVVGVYPGWCGLGGYREGVYGYYPAVQD